LVHKSENKIWTTWKVIKKETSKIQKTDNISQRRIQDKQINNPTEIADAFNKYFITDKQTNYRQLEKKGILLNFYVKAKIMIY